MRLDMNKSFMIWAIAIIIAAIAWSLDGTLIRPNFYSFPALNIVFLEHLFWAIILSPFLFWWWPKIQNMSQNTVMSILWVSFFWWLLGTLMITKAYFAAFAGETTLSTVIILQKLQPFFAILLAWIFLKEKLTKSFCLWAWIAVLSWYMIAFETLWRGVLSLDIISNASFYAVLAAFAFGSSTVFWKSLVSELWFRLSTALRFTWTAIMACIAIILFWDFLSITHLEMMHWQLLVLVVFTSGAAAIFLYYYWLRKVTASSATIFELAYPLSGIFFDWYFNGNILSPVQWVFSWILMLSFFMIIKNQKQK